MMRIAWPDCMAEFWNEMVLAHGTRSCSSRFSAPVVPCRDGLSVRATEGVNPELLKWTLLDMVVSTLERSETWMEARR